ncbi:MAG: ADP-heptose--LPS heptosyltransferase 2 [Elusimicrobia bacterium]|nr:ADP-heptose--LPS heptosyltransferase 2 [Elusimicrobiota bacterium]
MRYNLNVKKILIRAPQWLGDAVVSTVFIHRLKQREAEARLSVLCVPSLVTLFETHPDVESVIPLPYPNGGVMAVGKILKSHGFDEVYILPRSFRSALEVFLAGIPQRIGFSGDFRNLMLTTRFPYQENRLYAHRYLTLIHEETLSLQSLTPYFPVQTTSNKKLQTLSKPILGMAPLSIAPARTWMAERFSEIARQWLSQKGGTVILFGSAKEQAAIDTIQTSVAGNVINTAGELSLPELGGVLKQCDQFLTNDSGLMHVASALNVPQVILFGASNPQNALPPWGENQSIQHKEISCVPCLRNHCVRLGNDHLACLKAISADEVLQRLRIDRNP